MIVHLRDWHFVDFEPFAADLQDENLRIAPDEISAAYDGHLDTVEQLQAQQTDYLRHLIQEHGLIAVYVEGVNSRLVEAYKILARQAFAEKQAYDKLAHLAARAPAESKPRREYDRIVAEVRRKVLRVGAAGWLFAAGELENIRPLEDAEAHERARPIDHSGKVLIEKAAGRERHDAMVRSALAGDAKVIVIVLGGGHVLTDSVTRLAPDAEYVWVTLKAYP